MNKIFISLVVIGFFVVSGYVFFKTNCEYKLISIMAEARNCGNVQCIKDKFEKYNEIAESCSFFIGKDFL